MRRFLSIALAVGLVLSFSLLTAVPALAESEVWVDDDFDSGTPGWGVTHFATIQDGIVAADSPGGTVHVAEGTYNENIILTEGIAVLGAGAAATTIDGGGSGPVVLTNNLSPATIFDGFTVTNGHTDFGGGMYNNDSSPVVSNCIFTENLADNNGGGMYNINGSSPVVVNCVFANNTATSLRGGGIYADATSSPTIINNTIIGNAAGFRGGGIYVANLSSVITNNIIASNTATSSGSGIYCTTATLLIDYNDVYSNTLVNCTSTNDPAADPDFIDAEYHIDSDSPCADAGDNAAVPAGITTDFEGDPRIWEDAASPTVDIGADEYSDNQAPYTPTDLGPPEYVNGSSVDDDTPELTFSQDDPNDYDTVQYTIEIDDDSDFSSPTEADTSALLAQGAASFTSSGLPDGDYYWRVMSTDMYGAESGWAVANGGDVAFHLDTSTPVSGGKVGGEVYPIDKATLLLPWLGLGAVLILAAGGLVLQRRRSR